VIDPVAAKRFVVVVFVPVAFVQTIFVGVRFETLRVPKEATVA